MDQEHTRTISIVHELMRGKRLEIEGFTIMMGDDMSIGFVGMHSDGSEFIYQDLGLSGLNNVLNLYNIGPSIPEVN